MASEKKLCLDETSPAFLSDEEFETLQRVINFDRFCQPCVELFTTNEEWYSHLMEEGHQKNLARKVWWQNLDVPQEKGRMLVVYCSEPVASFVTELQEYFTCLSALVCDIFCNEKQPGIGVFLLKDEHNAKIALTRSRKYERDLNVNFAGKVIQIMPLEDLLKTEWMALLDRQPRRATSPVPGTSRRHAIRLQKHTATRDSLGSNCSNDKNSKVKESPSE